MEKPLEIAWVGLQVAWGGGLRESPEWASSVSQVDGDSDVAPTTHGCGTTPPTGLSVNFCILLVVGLLFTRFHVVVNDALSVI